MNRFVSCSVLAGVIGSLGAATVAMSSENTPSEAQAQAPVVRSADSPARRDGQIAWGPRPFEECEYFVITETSLGRLSTGGADRADRYVYTHSLGLMKNVDPHRAIGVSVELYLCRGYVTASPTVHYRQWFGRQQSAQLSLGYISGHGPGVAGPVLNAKYSPLPALFVQGGLCEVSEPVNVYYSYPLPESSPDHRHLRAYGGVGLAGRAGAVPWVLEGVAIVALLALLSGLSN